jgi:hypothetical protein
MVDPDEVAQDVANYFYPDVDPSNFARWVANQLTRAAYVGGGALYKTGLDAARKHYQSKEQRAIAEGLGRSSRASSNSGASGAIKKKRAVSKMSKGVSGTAIPQGDFVGKRILRNKTSKRRKRPKSLKSEVRALKKRVGKQLKSTHCYREQIPLILRNDEINQAKIYSIQNFDYARIEKGIDAIQGFSGTEDFRAANTSVKITNGMIVYRLKNMANTNVKVKYQPVRCMEDDNDDHLQNLVEYYGDHGVTISKSGAAAASATTAYKPPSIVLSHGGNSLINCFGLHQYKWKPMAPVQTVRMGPGDDIVIRVKIPDFTYKPERHDQESFTHMNKLDIELLVHCDGDFVLGPEGVNEDVVGQCGHRIVGSQFIRYNVVVPDKYGLKTFELVSQYDGTNLPKATARSITNQDPAIEAADT